jgi:type VI secretion system lysozyme-like protein
MSSRSLFERLGDPHPTVGKDGGNKALLLSIQRSLQRILNTRHETASAAIDYGTSDISGLTRGSYTADIVRREIEHSIRVYEPRLANPKVTFRQSRELFSMHFDVEANVVGHEGELPLVFHSVMSPSGRIEVSSRAKTEDE